MKAKENIHKENSKNKTIREMHKVINEFKKGGYVIKKDYGIIVADTTSILSRW